MEIKLNMRGLVELYMIRAYITDMLLHTKDFDLQRFYDIYAIRVRDDGMNTYCLVDVHNRVHNITCKLTDEELTTIFKTNMVVGKHSDGCKFPVLGSSGKVLISPHLGVYGRTYGHYQMVDAIVDGNHFDRDVVDLYKTPIIQMYEGKNTYIDNPHQLELFNGVPRNDVLSQMQDFRMMVDIDKLSHLTGTIFNKQTTIDFCFICLTAVYNNGDSQFAVEVWSPTLDSWVPCGSVMLIVDDCHQRIIGKDMVKMSTPYVLSYHNRGEFYPTNRKCWFGGERYRQFWGKIITKIDYENRRPLCDGLYAMVISFEGEPAEWFISYDGDQPVRFDGEPFVESPYYISRFSIIGDIDSVGWNKLVK